MKKNNLLKGVFAVLLLSSPMVGAETKYPAADFKPTVQYQDSEYIAKSKSSGASSGQSQATAPDAKYPATAFQPKVLYKDTGYKHNTPKVAAPKSSAAAAGKAVERTAGAESATEKKTESNSNILIALVVLAFVGFVFFRKRSAPEPVRHARVYTPDASGLTGVAKYLQSKEGQATTGVARYLEKQVAVVKEKASSTGVAKYLEKKVIESETGVAKYLRNKG
ncbi:MAG: hypothetical protein ACU85E_14340 [Gammaproteobacteria bacterium]